MTEIAAKNAITAAAWRMGADVQTEDDGTQILHIEYADGVCLCGCHRPINEGSRFRQGHDMKLVSKLLLAARNDLTVRVTAGNTTTSGSAEAMALHFGGSFPEKLANRAAKAKTSGKGKKAAKQEAPAPAVDPALPRTGRAKVGRWVYDGTFEDGEFYYTNKKGEVIYKKAGQFTEVTGS